MPTSNPSWAMKGEWPKTWAFLLPWIEKGITEKDLRPVIGHVKPFHRHPQKVWNFTNGRSLAERFSDLVLLLPSRHEANLRYHCQLLSVASTRFGSYGISEVNASMPVKKLQIRQLFTTGHPADFCLRVSLASFSCFCSFSHFRAKRSYASFREWGNW